MKLYEQYKNYIVDNNGVDIEFPGYDLDLDGTGSEVKNKTKSK